MRDLSPIELNRLKLLNENSVSVTLIEPTKTGLVKGIMDATGTVRAYLKKHNLHDFDVQKPGEDHKVILDAVLVTDSTRINTKASLYRPKAKGKGGDPRIWLYGLRKECNPNDILALISFEKKIWVVNISHIPLERLINSLIENPVKEFIKEVNRLSNATSNELLEKLKEIAGRGFIRSLVNSDTGVGRTLESLLGIDMNSRRSPDYKGIELKSFRGSKTNRKGLFGKTPDWNLSKFKSRVEILDNFGYWEAGVFRLYNTIRATGRNAQGLMLKIEYDNDWLVENSDRTEIGNFLTWELPVLKQSLLEKHKETFWINTESKFDNGNEYFLYKSVEHTQDPLVDQLELLIEIGAITLDYLIKRLDNGSVVDKGCNFKLKSNALSLLFPPSKKYNLTL